MSQYTALFDANVLYPAPMRDALLQLAVTDRVASSASVLQRLRSVSNDKTLLDDLTRTAIRAEWTISR